MGFEKEILEVVAGNYVADKVLCARRNIVEKVTLRGVEMVVKRYKRPNLFNRFAYTFIRKTKARRAYEYAFRLLDCGIGTPSPVAYVEVKRCGLFSEGYFFSLYMPYGMLSDMATETLPVSEELINDFVDFAFMLHSKGVLPRDFNSSNIFCWFNEDMEKFCFALTDINRMRFGKVPSVNGIMRSFEQLGVSVEGMYKLALCYSSRKNLDVEYSMFLFLFHRMRSRMRRAFKRKTKKKLGLV